MPRAKSWLNLAVAKPTEIELPDGTRIPILYEDRVVMALDKPPGWILGPDDWEHTLRNLPLALQSSIHAGDYWARSRNLRFLKHVHRLDAGTSGILLCSKSQGAIEPLSRLFAERKVSKRYLAVTDGVPKKTEWSCDHPLGPDPREPGRHMMDSKAGKEAHTDFRILATRPHTALVEARPLTGRTHQIRLHLMASCTPVQGDELYATPHPEGMALRSIGLEYRDPFTGKPVRIRAPVAEFCRRHGFAVPAEIEDRKKPSPEAGKPALGGRSGAARALGPKPPEGSAGAPSNLKPTEPGE